MRNVEIKARCDDPEAIRAALREEGARFVGEDHQVDTYFRVAHGRLKLREGTIEHALIYYERPDEQGPKRSDVILYHPEPGASLKSILAQANGVLAVVDKRREIYFVENVKFHLDRVAGLGAFVEIEAIDRDETMDEAHLLAQCRRYVARFGIPPEHLVAGSYSDMVLLQAPARDA